jgi:hypothetical protein
MVAVDGRVKVLDFFGVAKEVRRRQPGLPEVTSWLVPCKP